MEETEARLGVARTRGLEATEAAGPLKARGLGVDMADEARQILGLDHAVFDQLGAADDALQRRFELVRDIRRELAAVALGKLLLRDVIREQLEGPDQPGLFQQGFSRWNPAVQGVEVAGLGLTLFQYLQRLGLPVVELKPDRDKVTRALPAAARYQGGMVFHLQGAPWSDTVEEELVSFPHGVHDDVVDTVSYAARLMVPMMQAQTVPVVYEEDYSISPV